MTAKPSRPPCSSRLHEHGPFAPAPTAALRVHWHKCADVFLCTGCFDALNRQAERRGYLQCAICHQTFTTLTDFIQWRNI